MRSDKKVAAGLSRMCVCLLKKKRALFLYKLTKKYIRHKKLLYVTSIIICQSRISDVHIYAAPLKRTAYTP